jgi:alpha-aminoadipic semialdehyde synthase
MCFACLGWFRNGKVTQGVLDILQELPVVKVGVGDLPALVRNLGMRFKSIHVRFCLMIMR